MIGYSRAALATALVGLSFALLGAGTAPAALPPGATILNPGNAEYTGYAIAILPDGRAWAIDATGRAHGQVSYALSQAFFADLAAAGPLAQLPIRQCTAPTGNTSPSQLGVFVAWHNQHTPNLQCGTEQRSDRLLADATAIARALYVQAYRARPYVIGGHSDAYRSSYSAPTYSNNSAASYSGGNYGSSYGGGSYSAGNYGYGDTSYGGNYGTYNAGSYRNSDFGVTPGNYGGNAMGAIGSNSEFGSSSFTSFNLSTSPFSVNVFGSANPFSSTFANNGDFGKIDTFGPGLGGGLPSTNLPSGSFPSSGFGSGLPTSGNITSNTPH